MSEYEPFTTRSRARCGTCRNFRHLHNWCEILKLDVKAHMSCGLYVPGEPSQDATPPVRGEDTSAAAVAKRRAEEARAAKANGAAKVSPARPAVPTASVLSVAAEPEALPGTCGDCRFFDGDETCRLFVALNKASRGIFDLNVVTHRRWRCEAQSPVKVQPPVALTNVVFSHGHPEVSALDAMAADQNAFADLVGGSLIETEDRLWVNVIETDEPSAASPLDDEADFEKFVAEEAR